MKKTNKKTQGIFQSAYDKAFNLGQDDIDSLDYLDSFDSSNRYVGNQRAAYNEGYYAGYEDGYESERDD